MAWTNLKDTVDNTIKTNGVRSISGDNFQQTLFTMIDNLGENATFAGIATPTTNPGAPDGVVFYVAKEEGAYNGFGLSLKNGSYVISNKTGSWVATYISESIVISSWNVLVNGQTFSKAEMDAELDLHGGFTAVRLAFEKNQGFKMQIRWAIMRLDSLYYRREDDDLFYVGFLVMDLGVTGHITAITLKFDRNAGVTVTRTDLS